MAGANSGAVQHGPTHQTDVGSATPQLQEGHCRGVLGVMHMTQDPQRVGEHPFTVKVVDRAEGIAIASAGTLPRRLLILDCSHISKCPAWRERSHGVP